MNRSPQHFVGLFVAILGGFGVFWLAFGLAFLNPEYATWLLRGDWSQHYLGWETFRNADWQWPPGVNNAAAVPMGTTLVYTDSLPLFAFLFKPFEVWLSTPFQYQGLWFALGWALQGAFAYLIFTRLGVKIPEAVLASLLLCLLPGLFFRIGHDTLTTQWLLLAALYLYLQPATRKTHLQFFTLLAVAALVHAYILLMALAIWGTWWLAGSVTGYFNPNRAQPWPKWLLSRFAIAISSLAGVAGVMYLAGYFETGGALSAPGFGSYSLNLNALINPQNVTFGFLGEGVKPQWSVILPALPTAHFNQYEGFQYLGLGNLLLIIAALIAAVIARGQKRAAHAPPIAQRWPHWYWLALPFSVLTLWALTNQITLNQHTLLHFQLPWPLSLPEVQSVFRASGRLVWPVVLVLLIWATYTFVRHLPRWMSLSGLVLALFIQWIDIAPAVKELRAAMHQPPPNPMQAEQWLAYIHQAEKVVYVPPKFNVDVMKTQILAEATWAGVPVNSMTIARFDPELGQQHAERSLELLMQADHYNQHLFIFSIFDDKQTLLPNTRRDDLCLLDEYYVLPPQSALQQHPCQPALNLPTPVTPGVAQP